MLTIAETNWAEAQREQEVTRTHIRGSSLFLAGRFLSLGINFATQVLMVRYLSTAHYGALAYGLAVVAFLQPFATLGLQEAVSRFVPTYYESREYEKLFGTKPVIDEDTGPFHHVVWLLGETLVGIHQFPDPASSEPFNERRPGLDHLAFGCANRDELKAWEIRLNELGIPNGGIVDTPNYSALSFRDPDNIALEFFAPRG